MKVRPYIHSLLASLYVFLVAIIMNLGIKGLPKEDTFPASFLIPVIILFVFTLSAAVMGYLFIYEPAVLFLDGKKQKAVEFFFKTLGGFAFVAIITMLLVFGRVII